MSDRQNQLLIEALRDLVSAHDDRQDLQHLLLALGAARDLLKVYDGASESKVGNDRSSHKPQAQL